MLPLTPNHAEIQLKLKVEEGRHGGGGTWASKKQIHTHPTQSRKSTTSTKTHASAIIQEPSPMKEYLERGTNLEVNQVEAQEQEEYLSLSLSPSLLPQSRLSLSLSLSLGKDRGQRNGGTTTTSAEAWRWGCLLWSSPPLFGSSPLPAKYALESLSLSLSPLYYYWVFLSPMCI